MRLHSTVVQRASRMLTAMTLMALATSAAAQGFPKKPIKLIYTSSPGTSTESAYRVFMAEWAKTLGQPIIIDNRPGAAGRLGILELPKNPGDAHVLTNISNSNVVVLPLVDPDFRADLGKDYVPVAIMMAAPFVLISSTALPFRDLKGFIAYARANPGKLNVGNTGTGSVTHLAAEMFGDVAGINYVHIPFKTNPLPAILAGEVHTTFTSAGGAKPLIDAGRTVAIATTGAQRWDAFPNLPTIQEEGFKGFEVVQWFGLAAPPQTPAADVAKINAAVNASLKTPSVIARLREYGAIGIEMQPEAFPNYIRADVERWRPVIRKVGVKPDS